MRAKKRQQPLAKCLETSETASRTLAQDEELLQKLQSRKAVVIRELQDWRIVATETAERLKVSKSDVAI